MDDASRDPVITEDEIRELQFSAGDVAEIEQTVLSFVDTRHTRKVAMVVGNTINTLKERDGPRWGNLPDIYCAYLIRCLVFRGELVDTAICFVCAIAKLSDRLSHECAHVYLVLHLVYCGVPLDNHHFRAGQRVDD